MVSVLASSVLKVQPARTWLCEEAFYLPDIQSEAVKWFMRLKYQQSSVAKQSWNVWSESKSYWLISRLNRRQIMLSPCVPLSCQSAVKRTYQKWDAIIQLHSCVKHILRQEVGCICCIWSRIPSCVQSKYEQPCHCIFNVCETHVGTSSSQEKVICEARLDSA